MPNTIDTLQTLGYTVGIAYGDVQTEQDALAEAKATATPEAIAEHAATVTAETLTQLANANALPEDPAEKQDLATQIAQAAIDQITASTDDTIAFHERAVQIAKDMPNVWVISGPGITNVYVSCKPDGTGWGAEEQAFLDTLADQDAHKERSFQHFGPDEIVALALEARGLGAVVEGDATGEDAWTLTVDGVKVKTVEQLQAIVDALKPVS